MYHSHIIDKGKSKIGYESRNMPFKIYTQTKYMRTLSLAIASISISIVIRDGIETRSRTRAATLFHTPKSGVSWLEATTDMDTNDEKGQVKFLFKGNVINKMTI